MDDQTPNSATATATAMTEPSLEMDRLSTLPDVILEDILSLLPTSAAAAATSVLSRRWRNLWTGVTRFHFVSSASSNCFPDVLATVDSVLRRFDPFYNFSYFYLRLRLSYEFEDDKDEDEDEDEDEDAIDFYSFYLNRWFGRVCGLQTERINVDDGGSCGEFVQICVRNSVVAKTRCSVTDNCELKSSNGVFCLPHRVFQSETLTELILNNKFQYNLPEFVNLPNLKKLSLRLFDSYRDLIRTLFKSLPLLEDLTLLSELRCADHFIEISAPNLRSLAVQFGGSASKVEISIDAPKLEHIILVSFHLLVIRFVKIPSALSTAELMLSSYIFHGYVDDPVNKLLELMKGISCVTSLVIFYSNTIKLLNRVDVDPLSSFQNLNHLTWILHVIDFRNYDIPMWFLRRVKTIEVTRIRGREEPEMGLLENILSKANVLERLCVKTSGGFDGKIESLQKENEFVKALFMLPRVSSRCEIEFSGCFVHASTDGFQNGLINTRFNPSISCNF
ncbi:hypothetical protein vseg_006084 [Gypsophila vaccaria]